MQSARSVDAAIVGLREALRYQALLPVPATSFLGREREVAEASALLSRDDVRLLTLTGPGGVGKTRLAISVANALKPDVPDGIAFVPLAPVRTSDLVASAIAHVLGVGESSDEQPLAALIATLRGEAMLLVLDNFEHVVAAAPLVAELLVGCPELKVLATSRATLHVSGEREYPVLPLSVPDGDAIATSAVVAASGLINPRGFTWGADGTLYVALAGNGGLATNPEPPAAAETAPAPDATPDLVADTEDVLTADESGAVVQIVDGCPVDVAAGFPSYNFLPLNWADGVIDVTFLDDTLYALVDGGGEAGLHPDQPNGVYRILDDGSSELVADLSAWFRANPVAELTHDISPDAQPYAMIPSDGKLWITESNHEQLLTVTPDGTITRVIDLSPVAVVDVGVPTGVVAAPDRGVYIGLLSELPFPDGAAKVIKVDADGAVSDVWTGLTAVTDIALGPDGTLYASELATGNTETEPFYHPDTGKVVRQTGPSSSEDVATGLDYPVHLDFGPDGMLYVSGPALGANGGQGTIFRIDPDAAAADMIDVGPAAICSGA